MTQRLEDYWLGLRLQQMDIPAIHLVKTEDVEDTSPLMMDAVEMYLSIKSRDDRTFIRTARRNGEYVSKVLGNRPITSYSSSEAAQFRDWCFEQGMNINTVKRVFASVRSIINLTMREHGIEGSNAFSGTFMPDRGDASTRQPIPTDELRVIQQRLANSLFHAELEKGQGHLWDRYRLFFGVELLAGMPTFSSNARIFVAPKGRAELSC